MTYSWECKKCGHKFEEMTSYESRSKECPICKGEIKQKYTISKAIWKVNLGR